MLEFMELQGSLQHRERVLEEFASRAEGMTLDVATGSGYLARHLLNKRAKVFCVDVDPAALMRTKNELSHRKGFYFVCCDARKLPFRDGSFDSVLTWSALVHIPEWRIAVSEMFRVSNGVVATCEPSGGYSVRAWRDYRCAHESPTPEEISMEFARYGKAERFEKRVFIEEIRCIKP